MPRVGKCIHSPEEVAVLATLHASSWYRQDDSKNEDRDKTTINPQHGRYPFVRIPTGLLNAQSMFQETMDAALSVVDWQFALLYIDDIAVFCRYAAEQINHLENLLTLVRNLKATLTSKKCSFYIDAINYLHYVIYPTHV